MKKNKSLIFKKLLLALAFCGMINPGFALPVSNHHSSPSHSHASHAGTKSSKASTTHKATAHTNKATNKTNKTNKSKTVKTNKTKSKPTKPHAHKTTATQKHAKTTNKKTKTTKALTKTTKHSKNKTHVATITKSIPAATADANNMNDFINANTTTSKHLVAYIDNFMSSLRYTTYRSGDRIFDTMHGIFELDCSHYVDHILQNACPQAYHSLVSSTGSTSPDSQNYFDFFNRLSAHMKSDWDAVDDAKQLQAGDVLVFRYLNSHGNSSGGHVMMVMGTPIIKDNNLFVRVTDSAEASHSDDTRAEHSSGVGIGTMVLKVNPLTGHPTAYAWDVDSRWQNRVEIAMARPIEMG